MNPRFAFDLAAVGRVLVAGADEAGRGCLAGPIVAASVAFDYSGWRDEDFDELDGLNDSKKVAPARRALLYSAILACAKQVAIVSLDAATIDRRGLHVCNLLALSRSIEQLNPIPGKVFVDGFALKDCATPHEALVRGDSRSAVVAAASVIAKVTRDRIMSDLHASQPQWSFDVHMGYATPLHHECILANGVSSQHRMSFRSVAYQQLGMIPERD